MSDDKSWLYDIKFTKGTACRYDFDPEALEVDEGYQGLLDEIHARAMRRLQIIEAATLTNYDRSCAICDLQREVQYEREPVVRAYTQFLSLYMRPVIMMPVGVISAIGT